MGQPCDYDRQRWEDEQRLADRKFEGLAGQIKLAEVGSPLLAGEAQDQSRSTSAAWGSDQRGTADYNRRRSSRGDQQQTVRSIVHGRIAITYITRIVAEGWTLILEEAIRTPHPEK